MMLGGIYSLYWDNIDPQLVTAQRKVFSSFDFPISQHRIDGIDHGEWIDWVMSRSDDMDVYLFIDIDCIPLNKGKMISNMQMAGAGNLIGAEGAANHIDSSRSYAGAWYCYIGRQQWANFNKPSAKATPYSDVCQIWTDVWKTRSAPVTLIPPTSSVFPRWELPGRENAYGIGTTYGDECFHLFGSREGKSDSDLFITKCQEVSALAHINKC